jgi:hypothetical protein
MIFHYPQPGISVRHLILPPHLHLVGNEELLDRFQELLPREKVVRKMSGIFIRSISDHESNQ